MVVENFAVGEPIIIFEGKLEDVSINLTGKLFQPNLNIVEEVDLAWERLCTNAKKSGQKIWEGEFYRVEKIDQINQRLNLDLGITTYRWASVFPKLAIEKGISPKELAYPIYTDCLVQTLDGYFVTIQRGAANALTNQNNFFFVGGGLQPTSKFQVTSSKSIEENMLLELNEEIGIKQNQIETLELKAILITEYLAIDFFFIAKLNITKQDLEVHFTNREEQWETAGLVFHTREEFIALANKSTKWQKCVKKYISLKNT